MKKLNEKSNVDFQTLSEKIQSNKGLKTALYIGIAVLTLYLLGKACKGLAETVRGFNDLKSAMNGN
jgi:hypothetical protein